MFSFKDILAQPSHSPNGGRSWMMGGFQSLESIGGKVKSFCYYICRR